MQAIHSTRPGGHVGFVGVSHDVAIPGDELFMAGVHLHGGPAPVRRFLPELIQLIWDRKIDPGKVFDLTLPLEQGRRGLPGHGRAHRHQGPAHPLSPAVTMRTMSSPTASAPADRGCRATVAWSVPVRRGRDRQRHDPARGARAATRRRPRAPAAAPRRRRTG